MGQKKYSNLTDEKLKDSVGKSVSNARKRLAEMLSDEKIIEQFSSQEKIEDFMDDMAFAIQEMLDLHVDSVKKTETDSKIEEIKEIVDNASNDLDDVFKQLTSRSKSFWEKRREPDSYRRSKRSSKIRQTTFDDLAKRRRRTRRP
jgi:hypothetical protein